jgi:hypothetical protein
VPIFPQSLSDIEIIGAAISEGHYRRLRDFYNSRTRLHCNIYTPSGKGRRSALDVRRSGTPESRGTVGPVRRVLARNIWQVAGKAVKDETSENCDTPPGKIS